MTGPHLDQVRERERRGPYKNKETKLCLNQKFNKLLRADACLDFNMNRSNLGIKETGF